MGFIFYKKQQHMIRKNITFSEGMLSDARKVWRENGMVPVLEKKAALLVRAYCLGVHLNVKDCPDYVLPQNGLALWWLATLVEDIQAKTMFAPSIYPALAWPWRDGFKVKADLNPEERVLVDKTSDLILDGDEIAYDNSTANVVIIVDDWQGLVRAAKQAGISVQDKFEDAIRKYRLYKDEVIYALKSRAKIAAAANARAWRRAKKDQVPEGLIPIPDYLAA